MELFNKNKKRHNYNFATLQLHRLLHVSVDIQKSKNELKMFIKVHYSLIQY